MPGAVQDERRRYRAGVNLDTFRRTRQQPEPALA